MAGFTKGLQESGFISGRNVTVEYRWADGHYDGLPALAAELVSLPVNVLDHIKALEHAARLATPHCCAPERDRGRGW